MAGDVDHLQRIGTTKEQSRENQDAIVEMEEMAANLALVKNGMVSNQFAEELHKKLKRICASDEIIAQIKELEPFR